MNTPILDFLKSYDGVVRLHMPGHKGKVNPYDITEVDGADVLYSPHGIIAESEKNAAEIFGTAKTAYSVEGSSLGIRAAVYLVATYAKSIGKNPVVIAARNVHSTFISACALSDVSPDWLYGKDDEIISSSVTPEILDDALNHTDATAFYLTSPDYLGNIADVSKFADICHKYGALLVVDDAHGAYLNFLSESRHPIALGADIVVDSAHKTLPCLTGTAYVHISKSAPTFFAENLNNALSLFASTSPSYLLLSSLDEFNGKADDFKTKLQSTVQATEKVKIALNEKGHILVGNEPLKITISAKPYGYLGTEIASALNEKNIVVEFADKDFLTVMISPCNTPDDLNALLDALCALPKKSAILAPCPKPAQGEKVLSVREAVFSPSEKISSKNAEGRVLAGLTLSCPPAVPIAICGERLSRNAIDALAYYGIDDVNVIK